MLHFHSYLTSPKSYAQVYNFILVTVYLQVALGMANGLLKGVACHYFLY